MGEARPPDGAGVLAMLNLSLLDQGGVQVLPSFPLYGQTIHEGEDEDAMSIVRFDAGSRAGVVGASRSSSRRSSAWDDEQDDNSAFSTKGLTCLILGWDDSSLAKTPETGEARPLAG
mmetsp:Transcript_28043/g.85669  ORF Transcript_28043/g.85669 Transcript_28043/m.85669 type:complete len:117 (+) Transcript_28043:894-1244(+)